MSADDSHAGAMAALLTALAATTPRANLAMGEMVTAMNEANAEATRTAAGARKFLGALAADRTKKAPTRHTGPPTHDGDDLTQPLNPGVRYACEPNHSLGRWHVTEVTPELLAAQKELS